MNYVIVCFDFDSERMNALRVIDVVAIVRWLLTTSSVSRDSVAY